MSCPGSQIPVHRETETPCVSIVSIIPNLFFLPLLWRILGLCKIGGMCKILMDEAVASRRQATSACALFLCKDPFVAHVT
jgi:hypothetical protein